MNISHKSNLENKKDEWDKFEEQEFSLDFLNISNKVAFFIVVIFLSIVFFVTFTAKADPADDLPVVVQKLLPPPFVPIHDQVADGEAKVVKVTMIIEEKIIEIDDDGTQFRVFAFNDSVPGPIIVVHEGDYIELTLINPEKNNFQHNIDFHASTGALGGGGLTHVLPGEEVILRWKATKPGVFVYHCAPGGAMVPWHVVKGMNGAVMVLPRDGLKDSDGNPIRYDKAYYIGEQDFYIPKDEYGNYKIFKEPGDGYSETLEVMRTLTPSHVVFNGAVDSPGNCPLLKLIVLLSLDGSAESL